MTAGLQALHASNFSTDVPQQYYDDAGPLLGTSSTVHYAMYMTDVTLVQDVESSCDLATTPVEQCTATDLRRIPPPPPPGMPPLPMRPPSPHIPPVRIRNWD